MSYNLFYPEIFFSIVILLKLIFNILIRYNINFFFKNIYSEIFSQVLFILILVLILLLNVEFDSFSYSFIFLIDQHTCFLKICFITVSILSFFSIYKASLIQKLSFFEYYIIFLFNILASLLLISAQDFLVIYLLIEMQVLCSYILTAFLRSSTASTEAGLAYFIVGALISAFFLLGLCVLYGFLGTLNFNKIYLLLSFLFETNYNSLIIFFCFLITITFFFKLTVAPFHFWSPNVYEGAPLSTTINFLILPKLIFLDLFIRWTFVLGQFFQFFEALLFFLGLLSIFIGTVFALRQKKIKKLMIYSSISQSGFFIIALAIHSTFSISIIFFYLFIYLLTLIVLWNLIVQVYYSNFKVNSFLNKKNYFLLVTDFYKYYKYKSLFSIALVFSLFSISGIPPLSGFLSKIFVVENLISHNFILAIVLVCLTSISIFYYIQIIKSIYMELKIKHSIPSFSFFYFDIVFDFILYLTFLGLFLLFFFFFSPNLLLLKCNTLTLTFFNF